MNIVFQIEKETKNTIRFTEVGEDDGLGIPAIGTLYVPKTTLRDIGYVSGNKLLVTIQPRT